MELDTTPVTLSLDAMPLLRDPHLTVDYSARLVAQGLLRPMFAPDPHAMPGCATDATCLDGGRRWRVTVDDSLNWSDGRRLDAEDVVGGLTHSLRGRSAGVRSFVSADGHPPARVLDPATVEYRFDRPVAFASALLSLPGFAPRRDGADRYGRPLSLGPYGLVEWTQSQVTLRRNEFDATAGAGPDEVRFLHVPGAAETVRRYEAGHLDVTSPTGLGVEQVPALQGRPDVVRAPVDIFGSLDFGRRAPRWWRAAAAGRRALSGLLDRGKLEACTQGLARAWRWPGAAALGAGASEGPADDRDVERLRRGVEILDVAYSDFAPNAELATELSRQLSAALGVPVTTTRLSFPDYVRVTVSRDYCMLYSLTLPSFGHPAGSLSDWRSTGPAARRGGLADPVLDSLLDAAESCPDLDAATALWTGVTARWCELLPRIPLVQVQAMFLRGERLRRLTVTRSGLLACGSDSTGGTP